MVRWHVGFNMANKTMAFAQENARAPGNAP